MAITLHNSFVNSASSTSSLTGAGTLTASIGEIVVVTIHHESVSGAVPTVVSISDGTANVYTKRTSASQAPEPEFGASEGFEVWWTPVVHALVAVPYTVTMSSSIDDAVVIAAGYQGFTGVTYLTNPFDSNASLPKITQSSSATVTAPTASGISTTSTAGMLLSGQTTCSGATVITPSGWTLVKTAFNSGASNQMQGLLADLAYTSAQSGLSVTGGSGLKGWIFYVDALTDQGGGGGVTNNQTVSITSTSALTLQKSIAKKLAITSTSATTFQRTINKTLSIASTTAVTFKRAVAKILSITSTSSLTALTQRVKLVSISITSTTATSFARSTAKGISIGCTSAATFSRQTAKKLAITCTSALTNTKLTAKALAIGCVSSLSLTSLKVRIVTIAIGCASSLSMVRSTGKGIAVSCISSLSNRKQVAKALAISCVSSLSTIKQIAKSLSISSVTAAVFSAIKSGGGTTHVVTIAISCVSVFTGTATSIISLARQWLPASKPTNPWTPE